MLIYDCEIVKGILGKGEIAEPDIEYCEGWRDFDNMGISVICVYDYKDDRYRSFLQDNFEKFQELVDNDPGPVVGFNSLAFDNFLCAANGLVVRQDKSYDILVELWRGAGLGEMFEYPTHIGFGLDTVAQANFKDHKKGHGAKAPIDWQRGNVGAVVDYCLSDVHLTKKVLDRIIRHGTLRDPRDAAATLNIRRPQ